MSNSAASESVVVPVIDLSDFLSGADLTSAPRAIAHAATTSGFFQVSGHGIEPALLDDVYAVARELELLPREVKETLRSPTGHPYRGLMSNYDRSGRLVSEGYTVSRFDSAKDAVAHGVPEQLADYFHENVWPPVTNFHDAVTALAARTRALGGQLMRAFALALMLPIDYFDRATALDSSTSTIRMYPARHELLEEEPTVIFDEHCDGGMLTMLHQRGTYEGLQVLTLDGGWFSVPVHEEAFVINMGELMTRWTNGHWPATRHRVIASSDPDGYRFTLPTFYNVAVETVIEPLPTMLGAAGPQFEPVTVHDWQSRHIAANYKQRKYTSAAPATEAYVASLEQA